MRISVSDNKALPYWMQFVRVVAIVGSNHDGNSRIRGLGQLPGGILLLT